MLAVYLLFSVVCFFTVHEHYVDDGSRIAFIHVGNESIPAGAVELKCLVLRGSNKTYDSLSSCYPYEKYAFTKLRSVYRQRTGKELLEADFISFGLMDDDGMLTNAGDLIKKMKSANFIEFVSGYGKGKYRFKESSDEID